MIRKAKMSTLQLAQTIAAENTAVLRLRDFESVVLRTHLAVEGWLRLLLAIRLESDAAALPRLSFSTIAALALLGLDAEQLRTDIQKLNTLRNDIAHEYTEPIYGQRMWPFVARLRRSSGRRRLRWMAQAKLRFLKLNGQVFIQVLKTFKASLATDELTIAEQELTDDMRVLLDDPDSLFSKLDELEAKLPQSLPDPAEVTDVTAARIASSTAAKIYEAAMTKLSAARANRLISDGDWAEIVFHAGEVRQRGQALIQTIRRWREADLEAVILQHYIELVPSIRWFQQRLSPGAA